MSTKSWRRKQMSFCPHLLHSRLTSTYPFSNRSQSTSETGCLKRARQGLVESTLQGQEPLAHLARQMCTKHLEWNTLEHRVDCLCAKRNGKGLHSIPEKLKTSSNFEQNKKKKKKRTVLQPLGLLCFKKMNMTSFHNWITSQQIKAFIFKSKTNSSWKEKVCFPMNIPAGLSQLSVVQLIY